MSAPWGLRRISDAVVPQVRRETPTLTSQRFTARHRNPLIPLINLTA